MRIFSPSSWLRTRAVTVAVGEGRRAVATEEQDARLEGLALVDLEAVDEQVLALADAVLLTAETDDCVAAHER